MFWRPFIGGFLIASLCFLLVLKKQADYSQSVISLQNQTMKAIGDTCLMWYSISKPPKKTRNHKILRIKDGGV